ncbi:hypothetical protein Cgig2_023459 [Carnegiea gigantea]|uniref:Alpha/beta hydrolase fold-3 domain-containing protein n=1 Tax=Carnegiea gigantea TaxID=171969 RepID=A0A9Q1GWV7_9CARY|nr:hypothetical protein Cgig2_023459 [Carnegiea gigantea]
MPSIANLHLALSLLLSILPLLSSSSPFQQDPIRIDPYIIDYRNGTIVRDNTLHLSSVPPTNGNDFQCKDVTINIPSYRRHLRARVFLPAQPNSNRRIPVLVYFHGGGFCIGSPFYKNDTAYMAKVAAKAHVIALSLDYTRYPEGTVWDSYEDAWAFLKWVVAHKFDSHLPGSDPWLARFGDLDRVFVGGDSAGGNIAHHMAIKAGQAQLPEYVRLVGAFLAMPYFLGSSRVGLEPETITTSNNFKIWDYVCPNCTAGVDDPLINPGGPGAPSLRGLGCGRMMVYVAQNDELRERDVWYYQQVKKSGWPGQVELVEAKGQPHVFHIRDPDSLAATNLIDDVSTIRSATEGRRMCNTCCRRRSVFAAFFLLHPSKPPIPIHVGTYNTMTTNVSTPMRLRLIEVLAAWEAPVDSAFVELQLGVVLFPTGMRKGGGRYGLHQLVTEISQAWEL